MTPTSLILNSLLKERWSISFKLYKRKKKLHIANVQFTVLLAKSIKETLKIQKFDWLQTELGNPLEMKPCCCMVVCNSKSACVVDRRLSNRGLVCAYSRAPHRWVPGQNHSQAGLRWTVHSSLPLQFQWAHISRREQGPRSLNWNLGLAEIVGKTFLVTKFSFFFFFSSKLYKCWKKSCLLKGWIKPCFAFPHKR